MFVFLQYFKVSLKKKGNASLAFIVCLSQFRDIVFNDMNHSFFEVLIYPLQKEQWFLVHISNIVSRFQLHSRQSNNKQTHKEYQIHTYTHMSVCRIYTCLYLVCICLIAVNVFIGYQFFIRTLNKLALNVHENWYFIYKN